MTLRKRLKRLEARRGIGAEIPAIRRIIFAAAWREGEGVRAEPKVAMMCVPDGWQTFDQEYGESESRFLARVEVVL